MPRVNGWLLRGIRIALIAYLSWVGMLYFMQRDLIYYPMADPAPEAAPAYRLQRGDVTLRGWVVNPGKRDAIVYFGGNAERLSLTIAVARRHFADTSVYLLHYRGYGNSDGEPSEQALLGDALALYDDVAGQHRQIHVIGRSLGSAVASHVASLRPVASVVLITPFDSIEQLASDRYPWVPVSLLLKDKFESWRFAQAISADTLVLSAEHDTIVPRQNTDNLLRHFSHATVTRIELPDTGHVSISHHPDYYPAIVRFIEQVGERIGLSSNKKIRQTSEKAKITAYPI